MTAAVVPTGSYYDHDLLLYGRQSDVSSFGNTSTSLQDEDLLAITAAQFNIDPRQHTGLYQFPVEVMSGTDADIEIDYDGGAGDDILVNFPRPELMAVFKRIVKRYRVTMRPSIIIVYKLNRLARSGDFMFFLNNVVKQTNGTVRVWSSKEGWLNPGTPEGRLMLEIHCGMAGGGESKTKSDFVRDAHRIVAQRQPTRSMGERTVGYRLEARPGNRGRDEMHHVIDREPNLNLCGMTQENLVKRIYEMALSGTASQRIASTLNAEGLKNPHKGTPFTDTLVKSILRDSVYVGRRVRMKERAKWVGSKKRMKVAKADQVETPFSEELRIISDVDFARVQEILAARAMRRPGRKKGGGRIGITHDYHFTKGLLRCAGCGGVMSLFAPDGKIFGYGCSYRRNIGQPRCQGHRAEVVDKAVEASLEASFAEFPTYLEVLRKELAADTAQERRQALEANLTQKRAMLRLMEDQMFDPAFTPEARENLRARYNDLSKDVSTLQLQADSFGETEDVKRKRAQIVRAEVLASFSKMSKIERRAVIQQYVEQVWIWPDGAIHIERKGQSVGLSEGLVEITPGHVILYAHDWPQLDFDRMCNDLRKMWEAGWLTVGDFFPVTSRSNAKKAVENQFRGLNLQATVRIYYAALNTVVDLNRLRSDMASFAEQKVSALGGITQAANEWGLLFHTVRRLLEGTHKEKHVLVGIAHRMGINMDDYRPDLSEIFQPDYLDTMVYWMDANDDYSIRSRWEKEMSKRQKERSSVKTLENCFTGHFNGQPQLMDNCGSGLPALQFSGTRPSHPSPLSYEDFKGFVKQKVA